MSLNENAMSTCSECRENPCIWLTYQDSMKEAMMEWVDFETSTKGCPPKNNITRKETYKWFIRMKYGYLGKGKRVEIPACFLARVREIYPDEEEDYIGFKAK